jgi:hypothetical protein
VIKSGALPDFVIGLSDESAVLFMASYYAGYPFLSMAEKPLCGFLAAGGIPPAPPVSQAMSEGPGALRRAGALPVFGGAYPAASGPRGREKARPGRAG